MSSPKIESNKTLSLSKLNINIEPIDAFFLLQKEVTYLFSEFNNLDFLSLSKNLNLNFYENKKELNIKVNDKLISGTFKEINSHGELILDTYNNNKKKISFGEII